jgi:hypothetical protein
LCWVTTDTIPFEREEESGEHVQMMRNHIMIENEINYCNISHVGIGVIAFDIVDNNG